MRGDRVWHVAGARRICSGQLESVLRKLDAAAANFHTTSADFEFDTVMTVPIYDKDVQKGTAYYKRDGHSFQMAAHITEVNGKPVPKDLTYSGGKVILFEPMLNQAGVMDAAKYESYLLLGFGASGKELEDKWHIKYLGQENGGRHQDRQAGAGGQRPECAEAVSQGHDLAGYRTRGEPAAGV